MQDCSQPSDQARVNFAVQVRMQQGELSRALAAQLEQHQTSLEPPTCRPARLARQDCSQPLDPPRVNRVEQVPMLRGELPRALAALQGQPA